MISFDRVTKRYGERLALQDVTWRMDEGECVVILGHSAAGKTTLLHLITHETLPTSGTVTVGHFSGGALTRGDRALLRRTLGVVDEDFRLLGDRSVFENVALAVRIAGRFDDAEVAPRVQAVLSEVGLRDRADRLPHELSYGERQRCAIARAIVNRPPVVIADEPTAALEAQSATAIIELLSQTNEILDDMLVVEGNLPTGHQTTIRTGLPQATWRLLNQGVQPGKSTTALVAKISRL